MVDGISLTLRIVRDLQPDDLGVQIEAKIANMMNAMAARSQRLVPKRTFALNDSIATETKRDGSKVTGSLSAGGDGVDYALYVERGTSRAKAQPFLLPALLQPTSTDFFFGGSGATQHGIRAVSSSRSRRRGRR